MTVQRETLPIEPEAFALERETFPRSKDCMTAQQATLPVEPEAIPFERESLPMGKDRTNCGGKG